MSTLPIPRRVDRSVTITGGNVDVVNILRRYEAIIVHSQNRKWFLMGNRDMKASSQRLGIHRLKANFKDIAKFLGLPDFEKYTSHSGRMTVKEQGGHQCAAQESWWLDEHGHRRWLHCGERHHATSAKVFSLGAASLSAGVALGNTSMAGPLLASASPGYSLASASSAGPSLAPASSAVSSLRLRWHLHRQLGSQCPYPPPLCNNRRQPFW